MGKRIYLPMGRKPSLAPLTERDALINKLYELQYLVPDAKTLDISHLRDIVQYAEQRAVQDKIARIKAGAEIASKMDPAELKKALNDYIQWRKRKRVASGQDAWGRK